MKITVSDYLGIYHNHPDVTREVVDAAAKLLERVDAVLQKAEDAGIVLEVNPKTKTYVSGTENGGFRPQGSTVGAAKSKHKTGHAVDVYDPENELDKWCMRNERALAEFDLYLEAATATPGWCHMQDLPPASGRRFFNP